MFGNWTTIALQARPGDPSSSGTPTSKNIKAPRKFPGPLIFPRYTSSSPDSPTFPVPPAEGTFYQFFQKVKKATDITAEHLNALNVSVEYDVDVKNLIPDPTGNGEKWVPGDDDTVFKERKRELLISNEDASASLGRTRRDIKLGHMYRFFQSVELVSMYYDSPAASVESAPSSSSGGNGSGGGGVGIVLENGNGKKREAEEDCEGTEEGERGVEKKKGRVKDGTDRENTTTAAAAATAAADTTEEDDDGKDDRRWSMPEKFREEMIKNFVEPICWGYGVRIYPPRVPPKVSLQASKFSLHLTNYIHLTPPTPSEARSGLVEGPVMGIQVRHEHFFRPATSSPPSKRKKRRPSAGSGCGLPLPPNTTTTATQNTDTAVAAALEDKMDLDPIETGEEGYAEDVVGVIREVAVMVSMTQDRAKGSRGGREGITEKKIRYRAVGRLGDDEGGKWWDDIYIITSLHHHISITHTRISTPYLRFLQTGKLPDPTHEFVRQNEWQCVKLKKSRYFDVLDPTDRVEAARAVSAVLGWVTRGEGTGPGAAARVAR